ncbi:uncharacterized protein DEA37_0010604 [Paragonimus westermani]|uniref:Uncharacterized protein n=1 Tax=Paragonimus westermani TaxID=34504 RepID=A0A5J4P264_9TREM|nr:uncharacterized protein DEA37_0010604 [Paragonimus westermani]
MLNKATVPITQTWDRWSGTVEKVDALSYVDNLLMLTCGGIPWQVYFQRVLSSKSARSAQILSYVASLGCIIMAVPSVLIGAVGASTDWNMTDFTGAANWTATSEGAKLVLPPRGRMQRYDSAAANAAISKGTFLPTFGQPDRIQITAVVPGPDLL